MVFIDKDVSFARYDPSAWHDKRLTLKGKGPLPGANFKQIYISKFKNLKFLYFTTHYPLYQENPKMPL